MTVLIKSKIKIVTMKMRVKEIRKQNFNDTDYYKKNVFNSIEIIISIDISDDKSET